MLHCQSPDCAGERRAAKVGPAGWGQRRAAAPWALGGEKGQWTSLLYLQLPEGLLLVRVCIPCWCQGPAGISLHGGALRVSPSCRDLV